jgi:hypothetical protein
MRMLAGAAWAWPPAIRIGAAAEAASTFLREMAMNVLRAVAMLTVVDL